MSSPEEVAYPILRKHDVDYVLVVFGGLLGYSGDDISKFLWMVRIAQGVWPEEIQEPKYFTPQGEYRVDDRASKTMKDSLMYKMSYYRFVFLLLLPIYCRLMVLNLLFSKDSTNSSEMDRPWTECVSNTFRKKALHWITLVCPFYSMASLSLKINNYFSFSFR